MKMHLLSVPVMAFSILAVTLGSSKAHEADAHTAVVTAAPAMQTAASTPTAQPSVRPSTAYLSKSAAPFTERDAWWKDR